MVRSSLNHNNSRARRGSPNQEYLNNDCHRIYSCVHCRAHLANHDELVSTAFQGTHGRAYLFNSVVNVGCGPSEQRFLMTGLHDVADIYCDSCKTTLGWKYKQAFEASQKYKEGKYIIELAHMLKENSWDLTSYNAKDILKDVTSEQQRLNGDRRRRPNYNPWPMQQESDDLMFRTTKATIITTNTPTTTRRNINHNDILAITTNNTNNDDGSNSSTSICSKYGKDLSTDQNDHQDRISIIAGEAVDKVVPQQLADIANSGIRACVTSSHLQSINDLLKINNNLYQDNKMTVIHVPTLYGENENINRKQQSTILRLGDNDTLRKTTTTTTTGKDIKHPKTAKMICMNTNDVDAKTRKKLPELQLTPSTSCSSPTSTASSSQSPSPSSSSSSSSVLSVSSTSSSEFNSSSTSYSSSPIKSSPSLITTASTPIQLNLSQFRHHQIKNQSKQAT